LSSWKENLLSYGGKLVLINFVLNSLATYMLSFFEVYSKKIIFFFWKEDNRRKRYRVMKRGALCLPNDQGGLQIINHELQLTKYMSTM